MTTASEFEPPVAAHSFEIEVTESHIDELMHVNNVQWVRWIIDAAVSHSSAVGLDIAAYVRMGTIWVVRRQEIDYLLPATQGERIVASTWVASYGQKSSIRKSRFHRACDGKPLLQAATTWVMVDRSGRPVPVPTAVSEKLPVQRVQR
jgi:acyl-CoA thioester hydrolase